jgi:hypothetical protein
MRCDFIVSPHFPWSDSLNEQLIDFLHGSGFDLLTLKGEPWTRGDALPEHNLWARHR